MTDKPSPLALSIATAVKLRYGIADWTELATEIDKALHTSTHDLCHDKHLAQDGPVSPEAFCEGCEAFQKHLYGRSPIEEMRIKLDAAWSPETQRHYEQLEAACGCERVVAARMATALQGVLNSACHPDIAIRAVMVNLAPVREALADYERWFEKEPKP